jgi:TRAP-type C4-dicarboxylate transport system substrate-binding protein
MTSSRTTTILRAVLAAAVIAALAPAGAPAAKARPDFQIKFATLAPEGSTWMKTMHAIDDEVRERTEGRLGFKFYPGGVQGDEKDVLRKIRMGQLHGGGFTGNGLGSIVSEARVMELPFLFETLDEFDHVRAETEDYFFGLSEKRGYLNLGWADVGFIYLFSKNPLRTPADLQAARLWVWEGDPLAELFFKAFDISPVPLSAPDVLTSLQTGIIDAVYNSTLGCIALQWFTRISYMTDVPVTHSIGAALVSEAALRKVDPADVAILLEVARPRLRGLTLETRVQNQEAIPELRKEGVELVEVSDEVRAEFFATGRGAWDDGVGEIYPRELLERVRRILADYRAGRAGGAARTGTQ